jgi:iron(III) transport system permease protein
MASVATPPAPAAPAAAPRPQRRRPGRLRRITGLDALGGVTSTIVTLLVGVPLGFLLFASLRNTEGKLPFERTPFTLHNYSVVFSSGQTYKIFGVTLAYAVGSVAVALVIVLAFAYLLERTDLRFRSAIMVMLLAPMALPPFVAAIAWVLLANPDTGVLNTVFMNLFGGKTGPFNAYSLLAMIFVSGVMFVPSMYLMISGTFVHMDASFEEASRTSGVGRMRTLWHVTGPLAMPGIASAVAFSLVGAFEIFEIPALLGMPVHTYTLSTWTYYLINPPQDLPNYGLASTYAVLTLVVAVGLLIAYRRLVHKRRRDFVTLLGRGQRRDLVKLGRWNWAVLAGVMAYCFITFILPLGILVWRSLLPPFADTAAVGPFTTATYTQMLNSPEVRSAVGHSLIIAVSTAVVTLLLSNVIAWMSVRGRGRAGRIADHLSFLSMGIPGIVIAVAVGLVYLWVPLPLYGTVWIIVLALATRFLAYGVRVMSAAYLQISAELEEASWTSGAGTLRTMVSILLRLVWPSFSRGLMWMFVHALRDATVAIVLASATNQTLTSHIWFQWFEGGNFAYATTLCVPLALLSVLMTIFVGRNREHAAPTPNAQRMEK